MTMKAYIPGTEARRERLFHATLSKRIGDHDGFAFIEWEDGSMSMKPVSWVSEISAIVDDDENFWFARGLGSEPMNWLGYPVWTVYAGNAGIISTEASLIADAERHEEVIDVGAGEEIPDRLKELGIADVHEPEDLDEAPPETNQEGIADLFTDGGQPIDANAAIYDLQAPQGYAGRAISIRDPDDFDPYPVSRSDAKAAADWFEQAGDNSTDTWMRGFIVGIIVTVVLALLFLGAPWLAGQIAGGGGAGGANLPATLWVLAGPKVNELVRG